MAFKVLNDEELSLLDDIQRTQYEEELDLYRQRAAFVERLAELENVEIEPYKCKARAVFVLDRVDLRVFHKTEYTAVMCEPVKTPELQIKAYNRIEQSPPVLPSKSKQVKIHIDDVKIPEMVSPDLPVVAKPQAVSVEFAVQEPGTLDLPDITYSPINLNISLDKWEEGFSHAPSNIPDIVMPKIKVKPFAIPEKAIPDLPNVPVHVPEIRPFVKPAKCSVKLPDVIKSNVHVAPYKEIKPVAPALPTTSKVSYMIKAELCIPELKKPDLPIPVKLRVTRSIDKPRLSAPNLPSKSVLSSQPVRSFTLNKGFVSMLPKVEVINAPDVSELKEKLNMHGPEPDI